MFSIVTPSFRSSHWLKLCVASVADHEGVQVEHIVQDARPHTPIVAEPVRGPVVRALEPTSYAIYTPRSPGGRVRFDVSRPRALWWTRR